MVKFFFGLLVIGFNHKIVKDFTFWATPGQ
jgi:hypothetical protein